MFIWGAAIPSCRRSDHLHTESLLRPCHVVTGPTHERVDPLSQISVTCQLSGRNQAVPFLRLPPKGHQKDALHHSGTITTRHTIGNLRYETPDLKRREQISAGSPISSPRCPCTISSLPAKKVSTEARNIHVNMSSICSDRVFQQRESMLSRISRKLSYACMSFVCR